MVCYIDEYFGHFSYVHQTKRNRNSCSVPKYYLHAWCNFQPLNVEKLTDTWSMNKSKIEACCLFLYTIRKWKLPAILYYFGLELYSKCVFSIYYSTFHLLMNSKWYNPPWLKITRLRWKMSLVESILIVESKHIRSMFSQISRLNHFCKIRKTKLIIQN